MEPISLQGLAPAVAKRVAVARRLAEEDGMALYLVGGLVRDLLLGRQNRDLDLMVEGEGLGFARRLGEALGGRVREHAAFLTAVVMEDDFHTDVGTARSERYRQPAALPEVSASTLRQDLHRRDFTINALTLRLTPGPPQLLDPFGGQRDLELKALRVLHDRSFLDDPTRVLRAVRLEQRLGFRMVTETRDLVAESLAKGAFRRLSGSRLREELKLLLDDPEVVVGGLERLAELGVLAELESAGGSAPTFDADLRRRLSAAVAAMGWYDEQGVSEPRAELWRLLLIALAEAWPPTDARVGGRMADRLSLQGEDREVLVGAASRLSAARLVLEREELRPSEVADALASLRGEDLILLLASGDEEIGVRVRSDLLIYRRFRLRLSGADLVEAGIEPGPAVGEALRRTRAARMDGEVGEEEELDYALAAATRAGRSG